MTLAYLVEGKPVEDLQQLISRGLQDLQSPTNYPTPAGNHRESCSSCWLTTSLMVDSGFLEYHQFYDGWTALVRIHSPRRRLVNGSSKERAGAALAIQEFSSALLRGAIDMDQVGKSGPDYDPSVS